MSNDVVISVEGLGKRYRIGVAQKRAQNLREALKRLPLAPFRYLQTRLRGPSEAEILWALKDVSFEVKRGEVLGVIGRNGAGKSTLLKILSRITDPTEGRALIHGRVNSLLEVGTGFHGELSGRENIFMNAAMHGMKRREIVAKMDEIIAFAEVEKFIDTPVKFYSSGMYVRLAFAVAAHLEPDILIVDEVLAVGDAEFQKKCMGKMGDVAKHGRTVLFVSHNMLAVNEMCSRCLLFGHGRLTMDAEPSAVVAKYLAGERKFDGVTQWQTPEEAPGNHQVRLKAVRILSDGIATGTPCVDREIDVEIDYWNLENGGRRLVSIWLINAMGQAIFTSGNTKAASLEPDPWVERPYPKGLFRTRCRIPAFLFNPGQHSIDLYLNGRGAKDIIILEKSVVSFQVEESERMRTEYFGEWIGAVRPLLKWETEQIGDQVS
ncbi:MAG TPA: ABC transporter ATP-binding protein [Kiritimatiellia bacterium]|nr:ABC transporter ATP-binding protein [Kiritimatiellia bacterium]